MISFKEQLTINDRYTLVLTDESFVCLRDGEPWRNLAGDSLVFAMFKEISDHRICRKMTHHLDNLEAWSDLFDQN
jgi:hypothetical protein